MSSSTLEIGQIRAIAVRIDDEALTVDIDDGRTIVVPVAWYPRLANGTASERTKWRLIADGTGINWSDLDEDIKVEHLILGVPSAESQKSLQRWLVSRR